MRKHTYNLGVRFVLLGLLQCVSINTFSQTTVSALDVPVIEKYVVNYNDVTRMKFIDNSILYEEGWQNLAQPKFWQQIMVLTPDSAIVNVASTRQVLDHISMKDWNKMSDLKHSLYKDSIRRANNISDSSTLLITAGKKDFYEFKKVVSTINRSIDIFKQNNVDPWYAQAILLIESPGKTNTKSSVGANGPFQLMPAVARNQGLIVNKRVDERCNIERSAYGASRLLKRICIPYVRTMLDSAHVAYNENDLWFRLLVLHAYHAGAGNVAGVIRKINPSEGGINLIQTIWQTTYGGFKNASQNYSQLALAAFLNFDELVRSSNDSVYMIDGDRMFYAYSNGQCDVSNKRTYLGSCVAKYETDLIEGVIPFDYFVARVKAVETEMADIAPLQYAYNDAYFNDIGFQLLKAKKMDAAYKVFKMNESNYPNSWNVYHGLGETYRLMGKKQLALAHYKKSLKLNPDSTETQRAIARLNGK
ncbi:MAG TPA: transglycosylase SLT domain-containing protein [Bacteroidia bacterium]|nr:transglycosylase SLT domain-containing protein [Bacteroidia bacterium]HRG52094.1 transglycosylase SLT domain-containing protein [Bacteroidia bacterium]